MKSNTSKLLVLALLLVLSATVAGMAQGGSHRGGPAGPARPEINAYFQANVLPVLRQQRQKLEPQLDPADRAQLATYRTQLAALKQQGQALRQSIAPAGPPAGGRPMLTDAQRQQVQQLHSQTRTIMLSVAQMAQKYEAPIRQLAQEVQPQKEKWAADIKGIVSKNATPEQQQRIAQHGGMERGRGGMHRFFKPAMFLLMDPNAPASSTTDGSSGSTSFYPNPAAATSQLNYDVKKAGPVTVDLLDGNGNKLRTLVSESNVEKGAHTQSLDLRDLPAGTYFYKITTRSGSETKRFVKE
ncbi:T9SS type A sorting domain-containing protein [Hymenobacter sp. BT770]|uniref:T9SS type A sorting domain-containing protein n=1 Tax=Hymenobacter sp. BT770 TaxID=2886942 RepID=UPI001D103A6D|nr:T9SS type A sorting domain-containing protein [Hymenobacter sp. BT770]MCC3151965.1 T9SS type A sorting domain-containing protein [Hymenobacter sp. BT770]MDO3417075.1 T9SS type A sorting domain-containing protein [Hymenobacter sp. BT770]